ncbi:hypothetical protein JOB18_019344 [Solea senegalensis]|uniref:DUF2470 domain-containing protein n=1 Tax=Solea senegalensis TaxID=28829 RepID=A0AAV6QW99_SOLSE|nr:hypothetical protein JOB18_019344 [Solea senegalensis]
MLTRRVKGTRAFRGGQRLMRRWSAAPVRCKMALAVIGRGIYLMHVITAMDIIICNVRIGFILHTWEKTRARRRAVSLPCRIAGNQRCQQKVEEWRSYVSIPHQEHSKILPDCIYLKRGVEYGTKKKLKDGIGLMKHLNASHGDAVVNCTNIGVVLHTFCVSSISGTATVCRVGLTDLMLCVFSYVNNREIRQ